MSEQRDTGAAVGGWPPELEGRLQIDRKLREVFREAPPERWQERAREGTA